MFNPPQCEVCKRTIEYTEPLHNTPDGPFCTDCYDPSLDEDEEYPLLQPEEWNTDYVNHQVWQRFNDLLEEVGSLHQVAEVWNQWYPTKLDSQGYKAGREAERFLVGTFLNYPERYQSSLDAIKAEYQKEFPHPTPNYQEEDPNRDPGYDPDAPYRDFMFNLYRDIDEQRDFLEEAFNRQLMDEGE